MVRARAENQLKPDKKNFLVDLLTVAMNEQLHASGHSVNRSTVDAWLTGAALPEDQAMHDALVSVLGLNKPANNPATEKVLAGIKTKLTILYDTSPVSLKHRVLDDSVTSQRPPPVGEREPATPVVRIKTPNTIRVMHSGNNRVGKIEDNPALPKRVYTGNLAYNELPKEELADIKAKTENFHEYMRCARILKFEKIPNLIRALSALNPALEWHNTFIAMIERGGYFPSPERFHLLEEALFSDDALGKNKFERLFIENRIAILQTSEDREAIQQFSNLPRIYWQEVLERHLNPVAWQAKMDKPAWSGCLMEITTQADYMQACRLWHEISQEEFATQAGLNHSVVKHVENGRRGESSESMPKYSTALIKLQDEAVKKGEKPYFSQQHLESLPEGGHQQSAWINRISRSNAPATVGENR